MKPFSVLQLTDLHILQQAGNTMLGIDTEYTFLQTLQHAIDHHGPFELILLTGDLAQDACSASYQRLKQHLQHLQIPCVCLPGNHDDVALLYSSLQGDWINCAAHRLMGNWSIISLNSQKPGSPAGLLAETELQMLERTLLAYPHNPTLITLHHPCVATGSTWLDSMQIENSDEFIALIKRFPQVKIIACGHIHQEFACQLEHVSVLATPSTCFQFTPLSDEFSIDSLSPGYRTFELFADGQWRSQCYRIPEGLPTLDRNAHNY